MDSKQVVPTAYERIECHGLQDIQIEVTKV